MKTENYSGTTEPKQIFNVWSLLNLAKGMALTIGLNSVDPEHYDEYLIDLDKDGILERMFKFNRGEVEGILKAGDQVTVAFTGKVKYNNGISSGMASFEGNDVIRVTEPKNKKG